MRHNYRGHLTKNTSIHHGSKIYDCRLNTIYLGSRDLQAIALAVVLPHQRLWVHYDKQKKT